MNSKLTGEGDDEDEDVKKKHIAIFAINFEHRDENQSCSACREWVKECESEKEWEWVWEWLFSIEMKIKVVHHVESEWMRDWLSVRVRKSEREWERVRECESDFWA